MVFSLCRAPARVLLVSVLLAVSACDPSEGGAGGDPWTTLDGWTAHGDEAVRIAGLVDEVSVEGGIWVIRSPNGEEWAPIELPEPFRIEGAGVVADVRPRPDLLSIGMRGTLVEVLRIRHGSVPGVDDAEEGAPVESAAARTEAPARLVGEWRIVEAHLPGVSTGPADAGRWIGQTVQYGSTFAYGPNGECGAAVFDARRVELDGLLSGAYGVPRESLPPVAEADEAILVEVQCDGGAWTALGATVLLLDDGTALTPWDGAFLTLEGAR
ncbi:hypothetical protein [Gaopeijia maritima]|uniref:Uncharacterized protein n=1 Tax=Gaopeijia maritima TaxID=3119007 RepID=A0ABU9EB62_9BACT